MGPGAEASHTQLLGLGGRSRPRRPLRWRDSLAPPGAPKARGSNPGHEFGWAQSPPLLQDGFRVEGDLRGQTGRGAGVRDQIKWSNGTESRVRPTRSAFSAFLSYSSYSLINGCHISLTTSSALPWFWFPCAWSVTLEGRGSWVNLDYYSRSLGFRCLICIL